MEYLHDRRIDLVINIPKNHTKRELDNGYKIRRAAVDYNIPLITNARLASAFIYAICNDFTHTLKHSLVVCASHIHCYTGSNRIFETQSFNRVSIIAQIFQLLSTFIIILYKKIEEKSNSPLLEIFERKRKNLKPLPFSFVFISPNYSCHILSTSITKTELF